MADWSSEYLQLIEDCEHRSEKLTPWEAGFIDSLSKQISQDRRPSPKQIDILDRIWEKATSRG